MPCAHVGRQPFLGLERERDRLGASSIHFALSMCRPLPSFVWLSKSNENHSFHHWQHLQGPVGVAPSRKGNSARHVSFIRTASQHPKLYNMRHTACSTSPKYRYARCRHHCAETDTQGKCLDAECSANNGTFVEIPLRRIRLQCRLHQTALQRVQHQQQTWQARYTTHMLNRHTDLQNRKAIQHLTQTPVSGSARFHNFIMHRSLNNAGKAAKKTAAAGFNTTPHEGPKE